MARRWQGVINENRVLAFRLGGEVELPAVRRVEQVVDVPAELRAEAEDAERVARGKQLYDQYCYMCHGVEAMSGGVIPDLRFASAATWRGWNDIVIGGVREQQGMRSFADVLDDEAAAAAIRAYLIGRAGR